MTPVHRNIQEDGRRGLVVLEDEEVGYTLGLVKPSAMSSVMSAALCLKTAHVWTARDLILEPWAWASYPAADQRSLGARCRRCIVRGPGEHVWDASIHERACRRFMLWLFPCPT